MHPFESAGKRGSGQAPQSPMNWLLVDPDMPRGALVPCWGWGQGIKDGLVGLQLPCQHRWEFPTEIYINQGKKLTITYICIFIFIFLLIDERERWIWVFGSTYLCIDWSILVCIWMKLSPTELTDKFCDLFFFYMDSNSIYFWKCK